MFSINLVHILWTRLKLLQGSILKCKTMICWQLIKKYPSFSQGSHVGAPPAHGYGIGLWPPRLQVISQVPQPTFIAVGEPRLQVINLEYLRCVLFTGIQVIYQWTELLKFRLDLLPLEVPISSVSSKYLLQVRLCPLADGEVQVGLPVCQLLKLLLFSSCPSIYPNI